MFSEVPTEGEVWISTSWDKYHPWEDGRGNYAWDLGALNSNMMSYSSVGSRNSDYEVWGKQVIMPMYGRVVTVERNVRERSEISSTTHHDLTVTDILI